MKKKLCVIGLAEVVCETTCNRLRALIGDYAEILCWCLETDQQTPAFGACDLYLATYPGTYAYAKQVLPEDAPLLLAGRFLNPSSFDRLLELPRGTKALAVENSLARAEYLMQEIARFGVSHLDIRPYYPGCPEPSRTEHAVALGAGRKKNVPEWMEFIDLGVKELTLTTYLRILKAFAIPEDVLNSIAHTYMDSVFQTVIRSNNLRLHLDTIINNVDEIVLGIGEDGRLTFTNETARNLLLGAGYKDNLRFGDVFPELQRPLAYYYSKKGGGEIITKVNGQHYVLQAKTVSDATAGNIGAVVIAKPVSKVQELENKVRRELKGAGLTARYSFSSILGTSPGIRQAVDMARRFADTPLTVLLEGESGVGKELFAQAIHQASPCAKGPFVAFNFSALPESLAESELFGYEEGAFTGARRGGRPGLFEQAHNGTIFLDELGDASLGVQTRLLRVLEEREVRRVGGERVLPVNVRVVAATNKDLSAMIADNRFREDLFYRICACPLRIPPLRERAGDVLLLASHFARTKHAHVLRFGKELEAFACGYAWPGNVRELQNMVTYLCTVVPSGMVCSIADLPRYLQAASRSGKGPSGNAPDLSSLAGELASGGSLRVYRHILSIYGAMEGERAVGRAGVLRRLQGDGADISHHALRRCLDVLKAHGLLRSGSTKQGTAITASGRLFLRHLDET